MTPQRPARDAGAGRDQPRRRSRRGRARLAPGRSCRGRLPTAPRSARPATTARVRRPIDDEEQRQRKQRHPDELRAERQRRRGHRERAEGKPRCGADAGPLATAQLEDRGGDEPDKRGTEEHQPGPPGDTVDGGQDDLRAPLLVEPGLAGNRERPRIDGRDTAGCQDLLARPEVVRQVGRGQRRDERGQHGQRHREERPKMPQAHGTESYAARCAPAPPRWSWEHGNATYVADVLRSSHGRGCVA